MRSLIFATVFMAMFFVSQANAGIGFQFQIGGYPHYRQPYYGPQPYYPYGGYRGGYYRSYGHYDYHPPMIYPHGNHFHVQPGHYHWHHNTHWGY